MAPACTADENLPGYIEHRKYLAIRAEAKRDAEKAATIAAKQMAATAKQEAIAVRIATKAHLPRLCGGASKIPGDTGSVVLVRGKRSTHA